MDHDLPTVLVLTGATASGKGRVGCIVAENIGAEIVSVDSMKIYRRMDIGTAKPSQEVRQRVRHHLIDVCEPWESFSLKQYVDGAEAAISDIIGRGKLPLLVGGTPLYLKGLTAGVFAGPPADLELREELKQIAEEKGRTYLHDELRKVDSVSAERLHPNDLRRIVRALEVHRKTGQPISQLQTQFDSPAPKYSYALACLVRDRTDAYQRIELRTQRMFETGLAAEVEALVSDSRGLSREAAQAVGYKEVIAYLEGESSLADAQEAVVRNTKRLARKQATWFRSFADLRWVDTGADDSAEALAGRVLDTFDGGEQRT